MPTTPELHYLALTTTATALMWIPYILARLVRMGPWAAMGNAAASFPGPAWAQRARAAHANAVENLVAFAALVLAAAIAGVHTPATAMAAKVYFVARIVHYVVYAAGLPVVRTLAFIAGFVATLTFATAILGSTAP